MRNDLHRVTDWDGEIGSDILRRILGFYKSLPLFVLLTPILIGLIPFKETHAIIIELIYDPTGEGAVDPCESKVMFEDGLIKNVPKFAACRGSDGSFEDKTPQLQQIVAAAAAHWEHIIRDNHTVQIRYWWLAPELGAPNADVSQRDAAGRPIHSRIRIPVDLNYFYDATPETDEEFDMRPKLYRTLHSEEQAEAFAGDEAPEIMELSYNGRRFGLPPSGLFPDDLFTTVSHEMGHALGLTSVQNTACDETSDPFYAINPNLSGGA